MKKLTPLKNHDKIGIAAPASHFDKKDFLAGIDFLEAAGFQTSFQEDIYAKESYLAGSDQRRTEELNQHLNNPDIKALLFARGGYGLMRLLPNLHINSAPKIIIGYSDLTPLLVHLQQNLAWPVFYGPVVAKDLSKNVPQPTQTAFINALTNKNLTTFEAKESIELQSGIATGKVIGGCLTLLCATMGTPYEINTEDSILFLEDVNEKPYVIDRMLNQLKLAGKLDRVKGFIFGSLTDELPGEFYYEAILSTLGNLGLPILANFPAGHGEIKLTLPLGIKAELNTQTKTLNYLESPFS